MDIYEETHAQLIVRRCKEAEEPHMSIKRYTALAKALSEVLLTI